MHDNNQVAGRQFTTYAVETTAVLKEQMLNWGDRFNICCFMDNHSYAGAHHRYECLLAAGAWKWVRLPSGNAFERLQAFATHAGDWLFGHFGFGLHAELFSLSPGLPDPAGFPDAYFFVPEHLVLLTESSVRISSYSLAPEQVLRNILQMPVGKPATAVKPAGHGSRSSPPLVPRLSRAEYIAIVEKLQAHIHRGDCYEINFCQEFAASDCAIHPPAVFLELGRVSPNPFAVYYKLNDSYLLCASPERYIRLEGGRIWSQPIKGTSPRYISDGARDAASAETLVRSEKERAENVMVVDLVRNDLSRVCVPGSVEAEEICGVYPFPQVFQMISTVTGLLQEGKNWVDAVAASFPMGSMTGAPKKKVLELIRRYETGGRGLFSGAVGYVDPAGNADFNVVIRSVLYDAARLQLSCCVGSGITWYADPAAEYEECLHKVSAILQVLERCGGAGPADG